jgi:uncharacterized protein YlxW (UPF0749 family)
MALRMNWETERSSRCDCKDMCRCIIEGIRMMTRMSLLRFTERDYTIRRMKKFSIAFLLLASLASAQAKDPVLSDATHAKIRDLQLQQKTVEAQYLQLQSQLKGMETQYNSLGVQITKAMDEKPKAEEKKK